MEVAIVSILPFQKSVPETELKKFTVLVYGRPKIGKTTLAAQFEDPLFLCFEPGARALSLYKIEITTWQQFKDVSKELRKSAEGKKFRTVVFDTFAIAYALCSKHVCKEMGIDHPSDSGYGKGWEAVESEFNTEMNKLLLSGKGVILIAHADDKDIEQPDGTLKEMTTPEVSKAAMRFINRCVDLVAYYYYGKDGQRRIRIEGTSNIVAGNRIEGHFIGISKFDAGTSAQTAYGNFIAAFNNKLGGSHEAIDGGKSEGILFFRRKQKKVGGS